MVYKKGDVVLCTNGYDGNNKIKNQYGKVIMFGNDSIGIEFFNKIDGHNFNDEGKFGHCWYVPCHSLKHIKNNKR